jgi:hypothetical protein
MERTEDYIAAKGVSIIPGPKRTIFRDKKCQSKRKLWPKIDHVQGIDWSRKREIRNSKLENGNWILETRKKVSELPISSFHFPVSSFDFPVSSFQWVFFLFENPDKIREKACKR